MNDANVEDISLDGTNVPFSHTTENSNLWKLPVSGKPTKNWNLTLSN